jgi:hypothetical protein
MLRKFAGALLAATLLTAPAFAEDMSKTPTTPSAPAAVATQPKAPAKAEVKAPAKTDVKADVKSDTTVKAVKGKHSRRHVRSHIAKVNKAKVIKATDGNGVKEFKATKSLKHVKHIKTSKRIHAKSGTVAATKSVTKTGTN